MTSIQRNRERDWPEEAGPPFKPSASPLHLAARCRRRASHASQRPAVTPRKFQARLIRVRWRADRLVGAMGFSSILVHGDGENCCSTNCRRKCSEKRCGFREYIPLTSASGTAYSGALVAHPHSGVTGDYPASASRRFLHALVMSGTQKVDGVPVPGLRR